MWPCLIIGMIVNELQTKNNGNEEKVTNDTKKVKIWQLRTNNGQNKQTYKRS